MRRKRRRRKSFWSIVTRCTAKRHATVVRSVGMPIGRFTPAPARIATAMHVAIERAAPMAATGARLWLRTGEAMYHESTMYNGYSHTTEPRCTTNVFIQ
eukprot:1635402-Rhodomonas_salina.1